MTPIAENGQLTLEITDTATSTVQTKTVTTKVMAVTNAGGGPVGPLNAPDFIVDVVKDMVMVLPYGSQATLVSVDDFTIWSKLIQSVFDPI